MLRPPSSQLLRRDLRWRADLLRFCLWLMLHRRIFGLLQLRFDLRRPCHSLFLHLLLRLDRRRLLGCPASAPDCWNSISGVRELRLLVLPA